MSSRGDRPSARRRWNVLLLVAVAALAVTGTLAAIAVHAPEQLPRIEAFVKVVKPWLLAAQMLAVGIVWLRWPRIVQWLAERGRIRDADVAPLLRVRHRVMTFVLVMVLTLGAGLPFSLLAPPSSG